MWKGYVKKYYHSKQSNKRSVPQDVMLSFLAWLYRKNIPNRYILAVELIYGSGLRISEMTGLSFDDVDLLDNLVLVIGKGQKERLVPITAHARRLLVELWRDEEKEREEVYSKKKKRRENEPAIPIQSLKKAV